MAVLCMPVLLSDLHLTFKSATKLVLLSVHLLTQTFINRQINWGEQTLVNINARKIQFPLFPCPLSLAKFDITFNNSLLDPFNCLNILGIVTSNHSWQTCIFTIAKSTKKLGILFRYHQYFSSEQLLQLNI